MDQSFASLEIACTALKRRDARILTELANQLSSVPPDCELNTEYVKYIGSPGCGDIKPITFGQLSEYFMNATGKFVPVFFDANQYIESSHILIHRVWLKKRVDVALESLGILTTIQSSAANQAASLAQTANTDVAWSEQPSRMTTNELARLHDRLRHQNDQRKVNQTASRESLARKNAEARILDLEIKLSVREHELIESYRHRDELESELSSVIRKNDKLQLEATEQKEENFSLNYLFEFMNPANPLSPPEGRKILQCWNELTKGGHFDIILLAEKGFHITSSAGSPNTTAKLPHFLRPSSTHAR